MENPKKSLRNPKPRPLLWFPLPLRELPHPHGRVFFWDISCWRTKHTLRNPKPRPLLWLPLPLRELPHPHGRVFVCWRTKQTLRNPKPRPLLWFPLSLRELPHPHGRVFLLRVFSCWKPNTHSETPSRVPCCGFLHPYANCHIHMGVSFFVGEPNTHSETPSRVPCWWFLLPLRELPHPHGRVFLLRVFPVGEPKKIPP